MHPQSPSDAVSAIPRTTVLRDKLCYGDTKLQRYVAFSDDLRVFRRDYVAADFRGIDLINWKSSHHRALLKRMAEDFLDKEGYGEKYWPTDPTSPNLNELKYTEDRELITQTMEQLIFRLNLTQYQNKKYKKPKKSTDPNGIEVIDLVWEEDMMDRPNFPLAVNKNPPATSMTSEKRTQVASAIADTGFLSDDGVWDVPPSPSDKTPKTKRKCDTPTSGGTTKRAKIQSLKLRPNTGGISSPETTRQTTLHSMLKGKDVPKSPSLVTKSGRRNVAVSPESTQNSTPNHHANDPQPSHQTNARQTAKRTVGVPEYPRIVPPIATREAGPSRPAPQPTEPSDESRDNENIEHTVPPEASTPEPRSATTSPMNETSGVDEQFPIPMLPFTIPSTTAGPSALPDSVRKVSISRPITPAAPTVQMVKSPTVPAAVNPTIPAAVDPTIPAAVNPTVPTTISPTVPATINPTIPATINPTVPATINPTILATINHTIPATINPTVPATISPASPAPKTPSVPSPTLPNSNVSFRYFIIHSRRPECDYQTWKPRGQFMDKSLSELINELPFRDKPSLRGLTIELRGPGVKAARESFDSDEDVPYVLAKERFEKLVRRCVRTQAEREQGGRVYIQITIEAVREGEAIEGAAGEEEDDVEELW